MTELEQAIAAITKATPEKSPWSVADFADDPSNAPEIDAHIATILNAVATGQLVPAQTWQPIETAPRDGTQILACLWAYGQPGGERRYEVVSWECDGWASEAYPIYPPTHWMPLPPSPAEGV